MDAINSEWLVIEASPTCLSAEDGDSESQFPETPSSLLRVARLTGTYLTESYFRLLLDTMPIHG